mgnify:CR=1 FL=1
MASDGFGAEVCIPLKAEFRGVVVPNGEAADAALGTWLKALFEFGCAWIPDELVLAPNGEEFIPAGPGAFPKGAAGAVEVPPMPKGLGALG